MNCQEFYSGWLIDLVEQTEGYSFHCWLPDRQLGICDRQTYPSPDQALDAARHKIRLETARLALEHCYWRGREGDLPQPDYYFLIDFILGMIQRDENYT